MNANMFAALLLAAATALAAVPAAAQGTPEQQQYCAGDAQMYCGQYLSDISATTACMRKNFRRLSPACRATMARGSTHHRRR